MISVAAMALMASGQAFSQGSGGSGTGAGGSPGATINHNQPSGGSAATSGGATIQSPGASTGAATSAQTDTQTAPGARAGDQRGPSKKGQAERHDGDKQGVTERNGTSTTRQGAAEGTTRQGTANSGMASKDVSLTDQQRTTIRERVLTSKAPRANSVNFDVRVGTVIPRSVHFATLPPVLIEIAPQWRGYRYFVYHEEIVVVDPRTLRIVAVLEV